MSLRLAKALAVAWVVFDFLTPSVAGLFMADSAAAQSFFGDNILINPWMELDQVNEGASTTVTASAAGTYTYQKQGDGWSFTAATSASSLTAAFQNSVIAAAPNGAASDVLFTVGTGSATHADGTILDLEQRVEPLRLAALQYGLPNAQPSYLSFCAKSSIAGLYSVAIVGGASATTAALHTVGSSWFHQFNIPTASQWSCYAFQIPGDTGGTWGLTGTTNQVDTTHGATIMWVLGLNGVTTDKYGVPTASAADGVWQNGAQNVVGVNTTNVAMDKTTGATFELTAVKWSLNQLPLMHNPDLELLQANRYYAKTFLVGTGGNTGIKPAQNLGVAVAKGYASAAGGATGTATGVFWPFPVLMRAAPTITVFDPKGADSNCSELVGANTSASTIEPNITSNATSQTGTFVGCAALTMTATGNRVGVGITADARL